MDAIVPWWASKGIWGGVVAVVAAIVNGITQHTITAADVAQAVSLLTNIATAAGGLMAIYGRVVASKKIAKKIL